MGSPDFHHSVADGGMRINPDVLAAVVR